MSGQWQGVTTNDTAGREGAPDGAAPDAVQSINVADYVTPLDMLAELRDDNLQLAARMRETHGLCDENADVASASLIEPWIDEAEGRTWFLFEGSRRGALADA